MKIFCGVFVLFLISFGNSSASLLDGLPKLPLEIPSIPSVDAIKAAALSLTGNDDLLSQILSKLMLDKDTIIIVQNFLETILQVEILKCTDEISEADLSESCIEGLNGAIDKWVQAAENNTEYAHIIKPYGLALQYFAQDAFEDVENDRPIFYCSSYNVVLPLLYAGTFSLNAVPDSIYELIFKPSISSDPSKDIEDIKEYARISKGLITAKVNAELNGKPEFSCCTNKSCFVGKALVNMATDMINNKEFAKYKTVCATVLVIAGLLNHFVHFVVDKLSLNF